MKSAIIQLNGETWRYKAQAVSKGDECKGCLFSAHRSDVCHRATFEALLVDQPDCEDKPPNGGSYIYVTDESDPRQMDLLEGVKEP